MPLLGVAAAKAAKPRYLAVWGLGLLAISAGAAVQAARTGGSEVAAVSEGADLQQALSCLSAGQHAQAEDQAVQAARSGRDDAWRAWLVAAAARQKLGKHEQAIEAYKDFLVYCQDSRERAYAAGRIRQCKRQLNPPPAAKPLSATITDEQRRKLSQVESEPYTESTEHFVVVANNDELAKLVGRQAEQALGRICGSILGGQAYPHTVSIYVWADSEEYARNATGGTDWAGGSFSLRQEEDGAVTRRIDLTQLDKDRSFDVKMIDRVLPHEMCHLVLMEFYGGAPNPLALNEGLAMLAEAEIDNGRVLLAGVAISSDRKIPLEGLLLVEQCARPQAEVFYAESYSFATFLRLRMTGRQFREMLLNIKEGGCVEDAIQRALYVPANEAFLARLAEAWEEQAIQQSQFLQALAKSVE
jgi:hypothetical protein